MRRAGRPGGPQLLGKGFLLVGHNLSPSTGLVALALSPCSRQQPRCASARVGPFAISPTLSTVISRLSHGYLLLLLLHCFCRAPSNVWLVRAGPVQPGLPHRAAPEVSLCRALCGHGCGPANVLPALCPASCKCCIPAIHGAGWLSSWPDRLLQLQHVSFFPPGED